MDKAYLCQGLAKYVPWAKSGLLPVLVWPVSQECFLYILICLKNQKKNICDIQKLHGIQMAVSINKIYWNMFKAIYLRIVCGCILTIAVELSSCDRD